MAEPNVEAAWRAEFKRIHATDAFHSANVFPDDPKAEFRWSGDDAETQADKEFQAAIEIAAAQGAKLPELRASVARARLLATSGERGQARDIVTPIYDWFSEGLETRDFAEARSLLAQLRSA